MFKEKGYDEFLAEKIQKGVEDSLHGRVFTADESRAMAQQKIKQKMQELETYHLSEKGLAYAV